MKLSRQEAQTLKELLEQVYEELFLAGATSARGTRANISVRLNLPEQYRIQDLLKRFRAESMTQQIIDKNAPLLQTLPEFF